MRSVLFVALVLAALIGCDDTVFPSEVPSYEPTWSGVRVFMYNECRRCHIDGGLGDPLVLPDDVEVDVVLEGGSYVVPGDPEASLVWQVISFGYEPETVTAPPPMPLGDAPLSPTITEHVYQWIEDGASLDY